MLTLHVFASNFGMKNPAPFCLKAETLLKMADRKYTLKASMPSVGPKKKLPALNDGETILGDSAFIFDDLKRDPRFRPDDGLSPAALSEALAYRTMVEEQLYFAVMAERWIARPKETRDVFFADVPALVRPLVFGMVRKKVVRDIEGHGMGRHSAEEVALLGKRILDALSTRLAHGMFFFGQKLRSIDAAIYPQLMNLLAAPFDTPLRAHAASLPALLAYCGAVEREVFGAPSDALLRLEGATASPRLRAA